MKGVESGRSQAKGDAAASGLTGKYARYSEGTKFGAAVIGVAVIEVDIKGTGVGFPHIGDVCRQSDGFTRFGICRRNTNVLRHHYKIGRRPGPDPEACAVITLHSFRNSVAWIDYDAEGVIAVGRDVHGKNRRGRTAGRKLRNAQLPSSDAIVQEADSDVSGSLQS